jgi:hypothetical protein
LARSLYSVLEVASATLPADIWLVPVVAVPPSM